MNKYMYLFRAADHEDRSRFSRRIRDAVVPRFFGQQDVGELRVFCCDTRPPRLAVIPFTRTPQALVSVVAGRDHWSEGFREVPGFRGGWACREALPVDYQVDWPLGQQTPGVALLTLFRSRRDIDREVFLRRWYQGHTPLSLEIHPLWRYERNQVIGALGDTKLHFDGIVVEHFRRLQDLLSPPRMFGGALKMLPNMLRVYRDVRSFIDLSCIQTCLVHETILQDRLREAT